jgi:hypothetical protein
MGSSETLRVGNARTAGRARRAIWPALALVIVAPLVAEYLLGNLPIKLLPALIVLGPIYGGGALLIREAVRRAGRGWPSILLLGMAYGIFEEAFTTQSLFNPNYLKLNLGLLTPAYIPSLGIGAWWTLWMLMVHGIWSISTPIALVEACVPDRARTPWLGRVGQAVTALVFLFGATTSGLMQYKQDPFLASKVQFGVSALAIVLLAVVAFVMPVRHRVNAAGMAVSAWVVGAVALLFGSAALFVPKDRGWGAVAALLALDIAMLVLVIRWSQRSGWGLEHQLALGAGAALAYGWHAFLQHPAVGGLDASVRVGNAIFLTAAIALIWFATKRLRAAKAV